MDEALLALLEGRFGEAERLIEETAALADMAPRWNARMSYRLQLYLLRRAQGRLELVRGRLERLDELVDYRTYPIFDCVLARLYDEVGRKSDAHDIFERLAADDFAAIPFDEEWLVSMGFLAEVAHSLGDRPRSEVMYERLAPYTDHVAVAYPEISTGSVARNLGLLAATLSRWGDAERHFEVALTMNERIGARPWLAHTQEDYAHLLRGLRRPGADEQAQGLLDGALEIYRELGMDSHAARISAGGFS